MLSQHFKWRFTSVTMLKLTGQPCDTYTHRVYWPGVKNIVRLFPILHYRPVNVAIEICCTFFLTLGHTLTLLKNNSRICGEQAEENNSTTENQTQDHWLDLLVLQELSHDHTINTPHDHQSHISLLFSMCQLPELQLEIPLHWRWLFFPNSG